MNEFYYELKVKPNLYYELFLDLLADLTGEAIEELDEQLIVRSEYKLDDIETGMLAFADELTTALGQKVTCQTSIEEKKNEDWIKKYQDAIKPVEVDKFYIHPSWEEDKEGKINILINPALAFGSGHHETTSSCIKAISSYVKANDEVLDVGSGSGILGIASSKLGAIVDICDTDPLAVENAQKNFEENEANIRNCWEGSVNSAKTVYDVVIANIVADVLIMIATDLKKSLKKEGILILSGILDIHKDRVLRKFDEFKHIEIIHKNEWVTIVLIQN